MPANLPPQYFSLSAKLKEAQTTEEKLSILEEMLAMIPKHKGTEKVQKDLKTKMAKLKKEAQLTKKAKKELIYVVKKEGAGQVVITGPPNSGKSSLLNALTKAKAKVADYPFTTTLPQPAMMPYDHILIQLVDTPPLTKYFCPGWLKEILRNSDGILVVFDLSKADFEQDYNPPTTRGARGEREGGGRVGVPAKGLAPIEEFKEIFKNLGIEKKKTLLVGNKADLVLNEIPSYLKKISALKKTGLEDLKREIFEMLEIIRVYSQEPTKEPDLAHPFTLKKGTRVIDLAAKIHYDLVSKFKYAKLFKKNLRKPLIVGKDYLLADGDIIEIH